MTASEGALERLRTCPEDQAKGHATQSGPRRFPTARLAKPQLAREAAIEKHRGLAAEGAEQCRHLRRRRPERKRLEDAAEALEPRQRDQEAAIP